MPKYVDIEYFDIAAVFDSECASWTAGQLKKYLATTHRLLSKLPTEEIKRAKWLKIPLKKYPGKLVFQCSNCSCTTILDSNYCPNCGCKLDNFGDV